MSTHAMMGKATATLMAMFLLSATLASGYIVGAARQHAAQKPVEPDPMPLCTQWGFMQPTPHNPRASLKCRLTNISIRTSWSTTL